jgi:hypothetical protein
VNLKLSKAKVARARKLLIELQMEQNRWMSEKDWIGLGLELAQGTVPRKGQGREALKAELAMRADWSEFDNDSYRDDFDKPGSREDSLEVYLGMLEQVAPAAAP